MQPAYVSSSDGGTTWSDETLLGRPANLTWAAQAGGYFLGDYNSVATANARVYPVWCRSFRPQHPETYHQATWVAVVST